MRCFRAIAPALALVAALVLAAAPAPARMVTDEMGRKVDVLDAPQRLIGLTPSLTEVIFALGLGDKAVGATTWADYPPAARKLPRVGAYVAPNLEQIVALKPDLVLANKEGNPPWIVHRLAGMGIPVYVTVPVAPKELPDSLAKLGAVLGAAQAGRKLAAQLKAQFAEVARRLQGAAPRPTLLVIGSQPLVTVGAQTMNHRLLQLAGGMNVAEASPQRWPRLNLEFVVEAKPQVIIVSTMERGQNLGRELEYWRSLPGVGDRPGVRVVSLQSDIIDRPGPRLGLGLEKLATLIHPERFPPEGKP
ncbi:MAG: cobalamin-binding protein [Desulfarculaceae bacterium]|nr:cobalamin-binding protein [Desulfarculaceae bacterium]MCF8072047.1 cobalamin-binding protein [Desulfarculaceae bacterium]MCF8101564.1 cobalamin-binding protein [Desulfarculaceae bacterium]MCF8115114.1 cobalamin-binding protein [Desulfarculaceae bacterium]